ncbi:Uu.00g087660.m01.CDS01 [Anthostomella pinea]|uniref:Uu.00g087660.m01.CDS01 n=1 Tax=Anthostomella pinea TaxID=933095 RepID=A0AAI8VMD5_9PEZI|nr:Uu.00g087660.m01.CDS01 [Anthostomella pinea]
MAPSKKRHGLDNPERVDQIPHRGEKFDRARSRSIPRRPPRQSAPKAIRRDEAVDFLEDIASELDDAKVQCDFDFDSSKSFLPRRKILEILTPERVRQIVGCLSCFEQSSNKDQIATDIYYGSGGGSRRPCLRLLAVLIGIEKAEDIQKLMNDGMSDACLPMGIPPGTSGKLLFCEHHRTAHKTINKYRRLETRQNFSHWSYSLVSPFIQGDKKVHAHYVLHPGDVLPMKVARKVEKDDGSAYALGASEANSVNLYGGFSDVYKVSIDRSHYDFADDHGMRHPRGFFALKKLTSNSRDNFDLELSSLLFSMDQYPGDKRRKHLIQILATFEMPNIAVAGSTYYLLFDWAEGSLSDFWHRNSQYVGDKTHCRWMIQQFYEITEALGCVHNERLQTLTSLNDSRFNDDGLYGRHGDIKPGNLLWFRSTTDSLVLSDFGLGRLHTQVSRSKQVPGLLDRSPTYRAPEFDLPHGLVSRVSDIFSLGCVFLEYITWFMRGLDTMQTVFPESRLEDDVHGFQADVFFTIRKDSRGTLRPELKDVVKKWIKDLQADENCSCFLDQLLDIIKDKMLQPDPKKRIESGLLIKQMKSLRRACEDNPSFYLKTKKES